MIRQVYYYRNNGFAQATAVRNFEVWVSATTPADASFTRVLAATAIPSGQLYTFIFPGGKVAARYVKYVPLTNNGGPTIDTQAFDVIAEGSAQVVSVSSQHLDNLNPAEAAFDSDAEVGDSNADRYPIATPTPSLLRFIWTPA